MRLMRMSPEERGHAGQRWHLRQRLPPGSGTASAGEKLDMSFIQGGAGINPEVWAALNGDYAPGATR